MEARDRPEVREPLAELPPNEPPAKRPKLELEAPRDTVVKAEPEEPGEPGSPAPGRIQRVSRALRLSG